MTLRPNPNLDAIRRRFERQSMKPEAVDAYLREIEANPAADWVAEILTAEIKPATEVAAPADMASRARGIENGNCVLVESPTDPDAGAVTNEAIEQAAERAADFRRFLEWACFFDSVKAVRPESIGVRVLAALKIISPQLTASDILEKYGVSKQLIHHALSQFAKEFSEVPTARGRSKVARENMSEAQQLRRENEKKPPVVSSTTGAGINTDSLLGVRPHIPPPTIADQVKRDGVIGEGL